MNAKPQLMVAAALDTVELMAYDFSANKDLLAQLLARNQHVTANIEQSSPLTAPRRAQELC